MTIEEDKKVNSMPENLRRRGGVYYADFRIKGRRIRSCLHTKVLNLAKQRLRELVSEIHSGDLSKSSPTLTLSEWVSEYLKTHLENRVARSYAQGLKLLNKDVVPYLGSKRKLNDISTAELMRLRSELWGKGKSATQNRKFALVKHLFSEARRRKLLRDDPARDVSKLKETPKKSKTLSDLQIKQILLASGEPFRSYILLAVSTGLRKSELRMLRRKNVEFDKGTGLHWLQLRNEDGFRTKNGKDRKIPLHSLIQIESLLRRVDGDPNALLLAPTGAGKFYNPRSSWDRIRRTLGFHDVTLHGLRRTFGTILHRKGVPIGTIQDLMGHSTVNQTRAYIDTGYEELAAGIRGLDQTLESLFSLGETEVWSQNGHKSLFNSQK